MPEQIFYYVEFNKDRSRHLYKEKILLIKVTHIIVTTLRQTPIVAEGDKDILRCIGIEIHKDLACTVELQKCHQILHGIRLPGMDNDNRPVGEWRIIIIGIITRVTKSGYIHPLSFQVVRSM